MKAGSSTPEVRYERLRPDQIATRRQACPVAYLPLGTLEWHGRHLPVGNDALKAHALCVRFAQEIGGLAMPPLYWGDNRADIAEVVFRPEHFSNLSEDHTRGIADALGLSPTDFSIAAEKAKTAGGWDLFEQLLLSAFRELESLGFEVTVVICGHYPTKGPAQRAAEKYRTEGKMRLLPYIGFDLVADQGFRGDHAARWETSLLMALEPDLVDLSRLGTAGPDGYLGVMGEDPATASAEYGEQGIAAMTAALKQKIQDALAQKP